MANPRVEGRVVLVTGGAGSIGRVLVRRLLQDGAKTVRIMDTDEYGLFLSGREFKADKERVRMLLGDVKDRDRMEFALRGIDIVYHVAAAKNIEITEYNGPETVRVNVLGTLNLVERILDINHAERFVYISTDKAVDPQNLYGTTKLLGEQVTLWANKISDKTRFSVVRFGNVIETRGNVFDIWKQQIARGEKITVTDTSSKRYYWHVDEAADFVVRILEWQQGGEIFFPSSMKEYTLKEVLEKHVPESTMREYVGMRKGDKFKELLMTDNERKRMEEVTPGICRIRSDTSQ